MGFTAAMLDLSGSAPAAERWSSAILAWSRKVRKLSMLDVSIMGCCIVTMSLRSMRVNGVMVATCSGVAFLFGAELCHYAAALVAQQLHSGAASTCEVAGDVALPAH